jgi:hypothetical protein
VTGRSPVTLFFFPAGVDIVIKSEFADAEGAAIGAKITIHNLDSDCNSDQDLCAAMSHPGCQEYSNVVVDNMDGDAVPATPDTADHMWYAVMINWIGARNPVNVLVRVNNMPDGALLDEYADKILQEFRKKNNIPEEDKVSLQDWFFIGNCNFMSI